MSLTGDITWERKLLENREHVGLETHSPTQPDSPRLSQTHATGRQVRLAKKSIVRHNERHEKERERERQIERQREREREGERERGREGEGDIVKERERDIERERGGGGGRCRQ